jgi:hypothetical protein
MLYTIYTDASCLKNPNGPGGYAAVIFREGEMIEELSGGKAVTTRLAKKLNHTIFAELTVPPCLLVFVLIRGGHARCRLASQNRKSSNRVPTCRPGTSGKCSS